jgi:hypothetical protein
MTRRELIVLVKNLYISFLCGGVLYGCDFSKKQKEEMLSFVPRLALLLGYLLYGDELSPDKVEEMKTYLKKVVQGSLKKKQELESLFKGIIQKNGNNSFEDLSPEYKESYFKEIMPLLVQSPGVQETLKHYLEGERVLQYLDYPDLPGDFGECGWLVLEGEVWDRYLPPSV